MKKHFEKVAESNSLTQANDGFFQLIVWGFALLFVWCVITMAWKPLDDTFTASQEVHLFKVNHGAHWSKKKQAEKLLEVFDW